jgi:hypothetical protein
MGNSRTAGEHQQQAKKHLKSPSHGESVVLTSG